MAGHILDRIDQPPGERFSELTCPVDHLSTSEAKLIELRIRIKNQRFTPRLFIDVHQDGATVECLVNGDYGAVDVLFMDSMWALYPRSMLVMKHAGHAEVREIAARRLLPTCDFDCIRLGS